jgi:hypothetical protein
VIERARKDGCEHDPRNPRLHLVNGPHAGMPEPIVEACARARDFFRRPSLLPSLNKRLKKKPRERRSERKEAHALIIQELLIHTDMKTWRIGNYGGDRNSGRPVLSYVRNARLNLRRGQRALEELTTNAGYLCHSFDSKGRAVAVVTDYAGRRYLGQKRIEKGDKDYEGLPAEREWTAKGLDELGVLAVFKAARAATRKAARDAAEAAAKLSADAQREQAADQQREYRRRAHIRQAPRPAPLLAEEEVKATHELAREIFEASAAAGAPISISSAIMEARRRRSSTGPPE